MMMGRDDQPSKCEDGGVLTRGWLPRLFNMAKSFMLPAFPSNNTRQPLSKDLTASQDSVTYTIIGTDVILAKLIQEEPKQNISTNLPWQVLENVGIPSVAELMHGPSTVALAADTQQRGVTDGEEASPSVSEGYVQGLHNNVPDDVDRIHRHRLSRAASVQLPPNQGETGRGTPEDGPENRARIRQASEELSSTPFHGPVHGREHVPRPTQHHPMRKSLAQAQNKLASNTDGDTRYSEGASVDGKTDISTTAQPADSIAVLTTETNTAILEDDPATTAEMSSEPLDSGNRAAPEPLVHIDVPQTSVHEPTEETVQVLQSTSTEIQCVMDEPEASTHVRPESSSKNGQDEIKANTEFPTMTEATNTEGVRTANACVQGETFITTSTGTQCSAEMTDASIQVKSELLTHAAETQIPRVKMADISVQGDSIMTVSTETQCDTKTSDASIQTTYQPPTQTIATQTGQVEMVDPSLQGLPIATRSAELQHQTETTDVTIQATGSSTDTSGPETTTSTEVDDELENGNQLAQRIVQMVKRHIAKPVTQPEVEIESTDNMEEEVFWFLSRMRDLFATSQNHSDMDIDYAKQIADEPVSNDVRTSSEMWVETSLCEIARELPNRKREIQIDMGVENIIADRHEDNSKYDHGDRKRFDRSVPGRTIREGNEQQVIPGNFTPTNTAKANGSTSREFRGFEASERRHVVPVPRSKSTSTEEIPNISQRLRDGIRVCTTTASTCLPNIDKSLGDLYKESGFMDLRMSKSEPNVAKHPIDHGDLAESFRGSTRSLPAGDIAAVSRKETMDKSFYPLPTSDLDAFTLDLGQEQEMDCKDMMAADFFTRIVDYQPAECQSREAIERCNLETDSRSSLPSHLNPGALTIEFDHSTFDQPPSPDHSAELEYDDAGSEAGSESLSPFNLSSGPGLFGRGTNLNQHPSLDHTEKFKYDHAVSEAGSESLSPFNLSSGSGLLGIATRLSLPPSLDHSEEFKYDHVVREAGSESLSPFNLSSGPGLFGKGTSMNQPPSLDYFGKFRYDHAVSEAGSESLNPFNLSSGPGVFERVGHESCGVAVAATASPLTLDLGKLEAKAIVKVSSIEDENGWILPDVDVSIVDDDRIEFKLKNDGVTHIVLGSGSFGSVEAARYRKNDGSIVDVAIKTYNNRSNHTNIIREAKLLQYLQDTGVFPHFYGFVDLGVGDETNICLVQELFGKGTTLARLIAAQTNYLQPKEWMSICIQLAKGLRKIHEKHIIYNDLKENNILVDESVYGRPVLKFIDVGISTYKHSVSYNYTSEEMANYSHVAPEVKKRSYTSISSDIYGLGRIYLKINEVTNIPGLLDLAGACTRMLAEERICSNDITNSLVAIAQSEKL